MSAKTTLLAMATLIALGVAPSVEAAPRDETVSIKVETAGLDLAREAGARVALNRVRQAADRICGGRPDPRELAAIAPYRTCLKTTVDRAVASSGAPALLALNGGPGREAVLADAAR